MTIQRSPHHPRIVVVWSASTLYDRHMNGGQVALTGFTLQVVWAVLDGFGRDDWLAATIEPTDEDGSLAKVDIRWELLGAERHDQVKSTINTFGEPDVRRWAAELRESSSAAERRLVLLGVPATGVRPNTVLDGVEVKVRGRDEETLVPAAAYLLERLCRETGVRPPYGQTEAVLELLVGLLLTRARRGHRWTRDEVVEHVRRLVAGLPADASTQAAIDPRERADRVQRAMRAHGMSRAAETVQVERRTRVFRTCEWPPPSYADPDGYHEVRVATDRGPGECEADGTNYADRITTSSARVEVSFAFGSQGSYSHEQAFVAGRGELLRSNGRPYDGKNGGLGFYPDRDEIIILHNGKHLLDRVRPLE